MIPSMAGDNCQKAIAHGTHKEPRNSRAIGLKDHGLDTHGSGALILSSQPLLLFDGKERLEPGQAEDGEGGAGQADQDAGQATYGADNNILHGE